MYIAHNTKYLLHKRHAGDTEGLNIRMRVTLHGERPLDFPLGISVSLKQWDAGRQRLVPHSEGAATINRTLDDLYNKVEDIFARYELVEKRIPSPEELKTEISRTTGRKKKDKKVLSDEYVSPFFAAFDAYISTRSIQHQWNHTTVDRYHVLERKIKKFSPGITFDDLNEPTMLRFVKFLESYGLNNTTLSKTLGNFRWFIKWAAEKGLYKGNVHNTFRPRLKGSDGSLKEVIYLTLEEIKQLREHHFTDKEKHLERVRDVLLFCCFTGLRYSDAKKLKRSDIRHGCIHVVTKKTIDGLKIELNKHSQEILDKYKDYPTESDAALPVISNEKMNEYLKDLGRACDLNEPVRIVFFQGNERKEEVFPKWQLLTTHVGRRTFVVTALQLGIPAEVIMKWTGHKDYKAMKPYVKIVDNLKEREMSLFNTL